MDQALTYATENHRKFVGELKDFLRLPSISTDSSHREDVRRTAQWLAREFTRMGMNRITVHNTEGHPIVRAEHFVSADLPTVLIYGHYDVQPPDPLDLWTASPFEPDERNGQVFARGASDDKGQVFMHVKAVEAYLQAEGRLPVNVKFLIEGEEESGSVHFRPFLERRREELAADVALISDTAMFDAETPSITYALRGIAYVEVELTGPSRDLHSGVYGGAVENPVIVLARLIRSLLDDRHRITIPGLYDEVRELSDEERHAIRSLPFDERRWLGDVGLEEARTEEGYSVLEATWARPSLDVNGIWGGYQGEGAKTVLPARAGAKISIRLVPDQQPDDVVEKLRRALEAAVPRTMKLTVRDLHGGRPIVVDRDTPPMRAAFEALRQVYGREPAFIREGGTIPVVADFKEVLGIDTVLLGFGLNSDAIHSPDEHFGLDRFRKGIDASIRFMELMGRGV